MDLFAKLVGRIGVTLNLHGCLIRVLLHGEQIASRIHAEVLLLGRRLRALDAIRLFVLVCGALTVVDRNVVVILHVAIVGVVVLVVLIVVGQVKLEVLVLLGSHFELLSFRLKILDYDQINNSLNPALTIS